MGWGTLWAIFYTKHGVTLSRSRRSALTKAFFLAHYIYQNWQIYTKLPQHYQMIKNIPNSRKIFQMTIKYTNVFHFKAPQNLPKLGFFSFEIIPSGNPGSHPSVAQWRRKSTDSKTPFFLLTTQVPTTS
jgi:hypothetical protein